MNTTQILAALKLAATKDNKTYAGKLANICTLIAELKKLVWFGYELGPVIDNTVIAGRVAAYKLDPTAPGGSQQNRDKFPSDCSSAGDIIDTFTAYQTITVKHGDPAVIGCGGQYTFYIPTNNAFCNYVLELIGHQVQAAPVETKKAYFQAILSPVVIDSIKTATAYLSTDTLRPAMCGVSLIFNGNDTVSIAATDAHRLYTATLHCETSSRKRREFIIDAAEAKLLVSAKRKDPNQPVTLSVHRETEITNIMVPSRYTKQKRAAIANKLTFSITGSGVNIYGPFTDARYPDYPRVIPRDNPYFVEVDRKELLQHIASNLPAANKITSQVTFHFNGRVTLECFDINFSTESRSDFAHTASNITKLDIAFNGKLLTQVLKGMKDSRVKLQMSTRRRAALIAGTNTAETRLIMPLILGV
jgi:DNA polymerase III sliding clamp (beta) subunit (PCNA family)